MCLRYLNADIRIIRLDTGAGQSSAGKDGSGVSVGVPIAITWEVTRTAAF